MKDIEGRRKIENRRKGKTEIVMEERVVERMFEEVERN